MLETVQIENAGIVRDTGPDIALSDTIELCLKGDIRAQERLYRAFFPKMMALVKRYTGDPGEATEIVNNGFLRVFKKLSAYGHLGSFEGWVKKIVVNATADYFRYKKDTPEKFMAHLPEPRSNELHDKDNYKYLLSLLYQLPHTTRLVINLFIIDGYTYTEIAAITNISESTCRWHISHGRKILQQIIEKTRKQNNE
ncbi:MAG: sigma-70 family RNA polymerase sigma factor [Chitinophagaceae bacterium]|nr:sigma-70 family RNA polymerase sigma factor [Chitinophagaceae bacterium]